MPTLLMPTLLMPTLLMVAISACCLPLSAEDVKLRRLTFDGLLKRDPIYTARGAEITCAVRNESPRLVLAKMKLTPRGKPPALRRLYPQATLVEFLPTFSRDEARHTFVRMTGNDQAVIVLFNGKQLQPLKAARKVAWNASISPAGDCVVYNLSGQVYRRDFETAKEYKLTQSAGRNDWPSVSPDGKQIAFSSSRDGNYEIYVCDRDGSRPRRLTHSSGLDIRPRWSPDGGSIVFTSNRDRNYEIYMVNLSDRSEQRLTNHEERDDYASWHPDGKRIVFVGERDGLFDLFELKVK